MLWAAIGSVFTRFVEYSSRLTLVYAGFAIVIAVVTWTYFGWLILLSGAQLSFYIQNPELPALRPAPAASVRRPRLEQLALTIIFLVAHNAGTGRPRYTLDALATDLGVTGLALAPLISALEQARVLKLSGERTAAGARSGAPGRHRHRGGGPPPAQRQAREPRTGDPGRQPAGGAGRCGAARQLRRRRRCEICCRPGPLQLAEAGDR